MRHSGSTTVRTTSHAVALAVVILLSPHAEASDWAGMLGYSSDNILHGRSLGDGDPAWIGDLHLDRDNWSIGLAAATERPPGQSRGAQLTVYVDRRWRFNDDWIAKIGIAHYESPWSSFDDELRYTEVNAAIAYGGRWTLALAHVPDTPAFVFPDGYIRGATTYVEASLHQPLVGRLAADFGVGHADIRRTGQHDYAYASAGLRYGLGPVYLFASVVWASPPEQRYRAQMGPRTRWVGSLVWAF